MPGNQGNAALLLTRCLGEILRVGAMCVNHNAASVSAWKLEECILKFASLLNRHYGSVFLFKWGKLSCSFFI